MSDLISDGRHHELARTALSEGAKTLVAVAGSVWASLSLNNLVALATLIFICLQAAYLVFRWRRDLRRS